MLSNGAADRPREQRRLQGGNTDAAVELRTPRQLVVLDPEPQHAIADLVPRGRPLPAAPVWKVVGQPPAPVKLLTFERVFELQLEHRKCESVEPEPRVPALRPMRFRSERGLKVLTASTERRKRCV